MANEAAQVDPDRQQRAREYARIRRRLLMFRFIAGAAYLIAWIALGWNLALEAAVRAAASSLGTAMPWWVDLLVMAAGIGLPWSLLTFPLSYYSGYVLPHRYELSTQSLRGWLIDVAKGIGVSLALGTPLLLALYASLRLAPDTWWIWTASIYSLVTAVLAAVGPVILLPIFFKVEPLDAEHEDLRQRLLRLAESAGTKVRGVFKIDMSRRTKAANAALTGLGRTRRILLGDTLLSEFEPDEVETILAHELAHHVHGDIPLSLVVQTASNFGAFYLVYLGLRWAVGPLQLSAQADPAGLPLVGLLLAAFGLVTMPVANAYSRWRESLADEYALNLTRKAGAFENAMTRLANQNLAELEPASWVVFLLYSHPPLKDRIARARRKAALWASGGEAA